MQHVVNERGKCLNSCRPLNVKHHYITKSDNVAEAPSHQELFQGPSYSSTFRINIKMFGTRRVTYRLVVMLALVLLVFVYFFLNSSHKTGRDAPRSSSDLSPRDAKNNYPKRNKVDVVVVEEHHEG